MTHTNVPGALLCARYAFAPNYYHYCGPDTHGELGDYLKAAVADGGLVEHLSRFETLYPYLQAIAAANGIKDPLDARVVDAYWVGNGLLERVTEQAVYVALTEKQQLPKRLPKKELRDLLPKIDHRARLHHSFHVFNVFTRTGHHTVKHTVETMDQCRIGWGKIRAQCIGYRVQVDSQQLIYREGKLGLVAAEREITIPDEGLLRQLKPGTWVSYHWGFGCNLLTSQQVSRLEKYTLHHIRLANETI